MIVICLLNLVYFSASGTSAKKFANNIIYSISKYFVPTEDAHSVHIPLRSHRTLHRALDFNHYRYYSQPLAKARTKQQNLVVNFTLTAKAVIMRNQITSNAVQKAEHYNYILSFCLDHTLLSLSDAADTPSREQ